MIEVDLSDPNSEGPFHQFIASLDPTLGEWVLWVTNRGTLAAGLEAACSAFLMAEPPRYFCRTATFAHNTPKLGPMATTVESWLSLLWSRLRSAWINDRRGDTVDIVNMYDLGDFKREAELRARRRQVEEARVAGGLTRGDLPDLVVEALTELSGYGRVVDVCRYVWSRYEAKLRASGDLLYTWQYDIRWAAQKLRNTGVLAPTESDRNGPWRLRNVHAGR